MPQLALGTDAYSRQFGNLPPIVLINFFAEQSITDEDELILQPRPGLETSVTRGAGPIHGIFSSAGAFNGDKFTVSGLNLYREGTLLGPILGSGPVKWAASDTAIVVTRGTFVYSYNGTDLSSITMPGGIYVVGVAYLAGLFVFAIAGDHKFYWNDINADERMVDSLAFASAELKPDDLLDVQDVLGSLVLIGQESIETWFPSGDADLPFSRVDQRLFSVGARNSGSVAKLGDMLFIVGNNGKVYRLGGSLDPISGPAIEEVIKASTDCSTYSFSWNGHAFFCIRLDDTTLAYDVSTGKWTEFQTYGHSNFRVKCATNVGDTPYFGDDTTGAVRILGETFADAGTNLEGYFSALGGVNGGILPIDRLEARGSVGKTDPLDGDDASPVMEMRYSRDAGNTFSDWISAPLGAQGKYRTRTMWRRLGPFDPPGVLCQFRVTDITPRRVSGVWINEMGGGRSR